MKKVKLLYIGILMAAFSCIVSAQSNYVLQFNGSSDYVQIAHNDIYNVSKVTIEMWINWQNTSLPSDVDFLIGKGYEELEIHTGGGSGNHGLRFIPASSVFLDSDPDVFTSNAWYHIAFVYDPSASDYRFYLNGVQKNLTSRGANPVTSAIIPSSDPLLLGARYGGASTFQGKMDEVRIWNYARSASDINNNMYTQLTGSEPGLIAYYKMSDGMGYILTDESPNGNIGFLINNPMWLAEETPLPVELSSFSADANNNGGINLNWSTATEVNNYGFEIQRSVKSQNVSSSDWQKIGFIQGKGNSNCPQNYTFTDENPAAGKVQYRLKQIDNDGKYKLYDAVSVEVAAPIKYALMQNSPNPFNPSTAIKFQLPKNEFVTVKIYDQIGREVTTLINEEKPSGSHIVYWNGRDSNGQAVSSGVYLYKLTAGSYIETRKMNLLK